MDDRGAYELARALTQGENEAACAACLDRLEGYVEAQLAGRPYRALFPGVAGHLDGCVACSEAYGLLFEALATAQLPEPARIPAPDLSFLGRSGGLAEALREAVEQIAGGVRLTLTRPLLGLMAPGPASAALRSADQAPLLELYLADPAAQVEQLELRLYPTPGDDGRCDLRAQVRLQGREWPELAGVVVVLQTAEGHHEAITDDWGEAVIEALPRAALEGSRLEVRL